MRKSSILCALGLLATAAFAQETRSPSLPSQGAPVELVAVDPATGLPANGSAGFPAQPAAVDGSPYSSAGAFTPGDDWAAGWSDATVTGPVPATGSFGAATPLPGLGHWATSTGDRYDSLVRELSETVRGRQPSREEPGEPTLGDAWSPGCDRFAGESGAAESERAPARRPRR